jgi:hypothetical protein
VAAATPAVTPCGGAAAAPARERAVGEYIALPPTGSVSRAALARQGIAALRARIRALDGEGGFRDSPDFLVDLATPATFSWSSEEPAAAPAGDGGEPRSASAAPREGDD